MAHSSSEEQKSVAGSEKSNPIYQADVSSGGVVAQGIASVAAGNGGAAIGRDVSQSNISTGGGGIVQHTGTGDIVNQKSSTNYLFEFSSIAVFFKTLQDSLRKHWYFLSVLFLVEFVFLIPFFYYRQRFSLSISAFTFSLIMFALALWYWRIVCIRFRNLPYARSILLSIIFTSLSIVLIGQQVKAAIFPEKIDSEKFGIAIATFGDNTTFFMPERGKNIADYLEKSINRTLGNMCDADSTTENRGFLGDINKKIQANIDPCGDYSNSRGSSNIQLKRIGVVKSELEALQEGKRVGADLVVWGDIFEQDDTTTVYFQLVETPLLTDNPDFPRTLPLNPRIDLSIPFQTSKVQDIAEQLEPQNIGLSYFILGLYYYHAELNPEKAANHFAVAQENLRRLENSKENSAQLPSEFTLNLGLVYYYLGKSLQLQGRYIESQESLLEAAKIIPQDLSVWLGIMYNFRALKDDVSALQMARCIIEVSEQIVISSTVAKNCPSYMIDYWSNPIRHTPHLNISETSNSYNQALAYEMLGEYQIALTLYNTILKTNPDFFIIYLRIGQVLEEMGRYQDAKQQYSLANKLALGRPEREVWVYLQLGKWYEKQGNIDGALLSYEQAAALNVEFTTPYLFQARIYETLGMNQAAEQSYRKYLEKSSEMSKSPGDASYEFARFLYRTGRYSEALENYYKALTYPFYDRSLVKAHIGQAYAALGNEVETLKAFRQAVTDQGPNIAYIYDAYGRALLTFDDINEAIEQFEYSIELNNDVSARTITSLNLAKQYESIDQISKAEQIYRSILNSESDDVPQEYRDLAQEFLQSLNQEFILDLDK